MVRDELLAVVKQAVQGDEQAIEFLCAEKAQRILFAAANILKDRTDAEDAAQEVILKLQAGIGRLKQPEYFDVWLYRIILNECATLRRKTRNLDFYADNYADHLQEERVEFLPQEYAEDSEKRGALMEIIQKLRPASKQVILMHYYEDMSYAEIAAAMDISVPKVGDTLRRARNKIKQELERSKNEHVNVAIGAISTPVLSRAFQIRADEMFPKESVAKWLTGVKAAGKSSLPVHAKKALPAKSIASIAGAAAICALLAIPFFAEDYQPAAEGPSDSVVIAAADAPLAADPQDGTSAEITSVSLSLYWDEEQTQDVALIVRGSVKIKDKDGQVVPGGEKYLAGLPVIITDDSGAQVAALTTDEGGRFSFDGGIAGIKYGATLDLEGSLFVAAAKSTENGSVSDVDVDGETGEITIYVQKKYSPDFLIELTGGVCGCGHVNPQVATVIYDDFPETVFEWTLYDADGGAIATGSGQESEEPQRLLSEGAYGAYTLEWIARDISGYDTVVKRAFKIVEEPVDVRLYE